MTSGLETERAYSASHGAAQVPTKSTHVYLRGH